MDFNLSLIGQMTTFSLLFLIFCLICIARGRKGIKEKEKKRNVAAQDKRWFLLFLVCLLYFFVLDASNCRWNDAPFGFVRGCQNYGIDWNSFMAPIGMFVLVLTPVAIIYWLMRLLTVVFDSTCYLVLAAIDFLKR